MDCGITHLYTLSALLGHWQRGSAQVFVKSKSSLHRSQREILKLKLGLTTPLLKYPKVYHSLPHSHHRIFAHAVPCVWDASSQLCIRGSFSSFKSQLNYHLLREDLPP